MKNISYVINGVLAIAIIILFILFFTNKNQPVENPSLKFEKDSTFNLPVAYVNIDSVLINYQYAKEANDAFMKKTESSRNSINNKQKGVEREYADFQRKLQNNSLTQEAAEQENARIQKLAADLQQTAGRLDNELTLEQMKINNQLADSVRLVIKEYNKKANYHIIFSNSGLDNILYAQPQYDITNKIIALLNQRHQSGKTK